MFEYCHCSRNKLRGIYSLPILSEILVIKNQNQKRSPPFPLFFYSPEIGSFRNVSIPTILLQLKLLRMKILQYWEPLPLFQKKIKCCVLVLQPQWAGCTVSDWVTANNMMVSVTCDIKWDLVQCLVERHFLPNLIIIVTRDGHYFWYHEKKYPSSK